jgi:tetratricopeptide (TPR) repeat protein
MLKKVILLLVIAFMATTTKAQTADEVYNSYLDFNLARLEGRTENALELGEQLMPNADKLTDKARISFYYSLGNLYENDSQSVKALPLYEKVAAAVPDYYVVQRALGYMYMKQADGIATKLNAAKTNAAETNAAENKRLTDLYTIAIKKVLPHLEKAQACDPDTNTLSLIKTLYKNIKDDKGLSTLNSRLAILAKNCVDLLSDK